MSYRTDAPAALTEQWRAVADHVGVEALEGRGILPMSDGQPTTLRLGQVAELLAAARQRAAEAAAPDGDHATVASVVLRDHGLAELGLNDARTAAIDAVLAAIRAELVAATGKFGAFASPHEGYAVVLEEVDELWEEVKADKAPGARTRQRREALQVAAMGARFLLDVEDDDPPVGPTVTDPITGDVSEFDPFDVDHQADAADEAEQAHAAGWTG